MNRDVGSYPTPTTNFLMYKLLVTILETKNIIRQNFISDDVGGNKAQILSERYTGLYKDISVSFIPKYATYKVFDDLYLKDKTYDPEYFVDIGELGIKGNDILVNLVDNEGFKKKLDVYCKRYSNFLFAAGVNLYNGQVYFTNHYNTNGYVHDHADLLNIFDEVSVTTCADADVNGTDDNPEQMFSGNDTAATLLATLFQTVLTDIPLYKRINFTTGLNPSCGVGELNYSNLLYWIRVYDAKEESEDNVDYLKAKRLVELSGKTLKGPIAQRLYEIYDSHNVFSELTKHF